MGCIIITIIGEVMKKIFGIAALIAAIQVSSSFAFAEKVNQLSDVRVRQAIAYAIDMETIADTLLEGKAIAADSMIPNGAWKAPGLDNYGYNPDKARALLKDAGWDDTQTLDVVYYYGDQLTADLMVALQAYLGDVGIKITYRKLEGDVGGQLGKLATAGSETSAIEWDMAYGAKAALALQEYYNGYQSGKNSYSPGSAQVDKLISRINGTVNVKEQKQAFVDFEKYENKNLTDIPLYYQQLFVYESDRINRHGGSYGNEQFNYDWGLLDWTVEADKDGKRVAYTNTAPSQFFEHPWLNPGITIQQKITFDRLLTADGSLVPTKGQLAKSFKVSKDGMSVSFELKKDLKWHDGFDLTGSDVKGSVELAMKVPGINAVFAKTFESIEGAQDYTSGGVKGVSGIVVDGRKVTFNFATLDPNMLLTFSQFPPLPMHLLGSVNPLEFQQQSYWQNPVGSGPYKIEEVQMNDFVRYTPFADYHGGIAKIGEIVSFPSGENDANVLKNAAAGRLDFGFTKSVGDVKALEAMENMKVVPADIPYTRSLRMNSYPKKP